MSEAGFRLYATDSPVLARTMRGRLKTLRGEQVLGLLDAQDWPDFRYRRGVIEGVDLALTICDQLEQQEK